MINLSEQITTVVFSTLKKDRIKSMTHVDFLYFNLNKFHNKLTKNKWLRRVIKGKINLITLKGISFTIFTCVTLRWTYKVINYWINKCFINRYVSYHFLCKIYNWVTPVVRNRSRCHIYWRKQNSPKIFTYFAFTFTV